MRRKLTTLATLVCALALAVGAAGCGSDSNQPGGGSTDEPPKGETTE